MQDISDTRVNTPTNTNVTMSIKNLRDLRAVLGEWFYLQCTLPFTPVPTILAPTAL